MEPVLARHRRRAETAARQLIRWESPYGWTRSGDGPVAEMETSLAEVLARMLRVADTWEGFIEHYLQALAEVSASGSVRLDALRRWHDLLRENVEDAGVLGRIAGHIRIGRPA